MSIPSPRLAEVPIPSLELEVRQLRAQVRALADLLIECGVIDAAMIEGRLNGAAARIAGWLPSTERTERVQRKRGFFSRLFSRKKDVAIGAAPISRLADETARVITAGYEPPLYAEPDLTKRRTGLTPTEMGKCEHCWRVRPLAADRLCSRCGAK
jgi:hypothetical protein